MHPRTIERVSHIIQHPITPTSYNRASILSLMEFI